MYRLMLSFSMDNVSNVINVSTTKMTSLIYISFFILYGHIRVKKYQFLSILLHTVFPDTFNWFTPDLYLICEMSNTPVYLWQIKSLISCRYMSRLLIELPWSKTSTHILASCSRSNAQLFLRGKSYDPR